MVKGISRRVIVVDQPDTEFFEQAIFIVRNEALSSRGVSAQMLIDEACRVARSCTSRRPDRLARLWRAAPLLWGGLGAMLIGAAWAATVLFQSCQV